jgi:hypothetical protein
MPRRNKIAIAFVVGGLITLFILLALHGLAQSQAGMSDGAGRMSQSGDSVSIIFICGYFGVSALGISGSKSKLKLWFSTALAHSLLLVAYALMFVSLKRGDPDGFKWHDQVKILALVMAVYFSPWVFAWVLILMGNTERN